MGARGRKSGAEEWITEDGLLYIEGWAREKLTDKQIAENRIGVAERTFTAWKQRYPAIVTALKKGRKPVSIETENNLYKCCDVMELKETIEEITKDGEGNVVSIHKKVITRQVAPNITAIIFTLKNLNPDKWQDKVQQAVKIEQDAREQVMNLVGEAKKRINESRSNTDSDNNTL